MVLWNWPPSRTERAGARAFYSTKMQRFWGALLCSGRAGGAAPSALASPHGR
jgi:hypothetical protein